MITFYLVSRPVLAFTWICYRGNASKSPRMTRMHYLWLEESFSKIQVFMWPLALTWSTSILWTWVRASKSISCRSSLTSSSIRILINVSQDNGLCRKKILLGPRQKWLRAFLQHLRHHSTQTKSFWLLRLVWCRKFVMDRTNMIKFPLWENFQA